MLQLFPVIIIYKRIWYRNKGDLSTRHEKFFYTFPTICRGALINITSGVILSFKFHFNECQWHFFVWRKHQSRVHRFYVFIAYAAQHPHFHSYPRSVTPRSISSGRQSSQFSNSSTNSNSQRKLSFCVTSFDTYYTYLSVYIYIYYPNQKLSSTCYNNRDRKKDLWYYDL